MIDALKEAAHDLAQRQRGILILRPDIEAICAGCNGSRIKASAATTVVEPCEYCGGKGWVYRR